MNKKWTSLCVIVLIAASGSVFGGVVTYQQWTFDDADNPALPEISDNPFGSATATIVVDGISGYEPGWYAEYYGHYGVWHSNETSATLVVPNNPVIDGYKDVWVEMLFKTDLIGAEITAVVPSPAQSITELSRTISESGGMDGWYILNIHWRIYPNPAEETIFLKVRDSGGDIDYITVWTECVPEPASLCLLGMGLLMSTRRKQK